MSKYNARKTVIDGITFDSMREGCRYKQLMLMQKAGVISGLQLQVKYCLIPKQKGERAVDYVADFVYTDSKGLEVVEDSKGMRTRDYVIKRKLMLERHGIRIQEV